MDCSTGQSVSVQDFERRNHYNDTQFLYRAFYLQACREIESLGMEITCPKSSGSEIEQGIRIRPSEFQSSVIAAQQPSFS